MATTFATALNSGGNGFEVAQKSAREASAKLKGAPAHLCLVFASLQYDLPAVLKGVRAVIGDQVQLIGCSSSGEFTETTVRKHSVAVGLISSDTYRFQVRGISGLKENVEGIFPQLRAEFDEFLNQAGETSVMMMIDGLAGNGEEATLCAAAAFGFEAQIVGGAAGDDLAFQQTYVIANDRILTDAVSVCVVKGPTPFFTGVKHGHTPLSDVLTATQAEGNVLYTIDHRNAWEVWKDQTRAKARDIGLDVDQLVTASEVGLCLLRFELGLETDAGYKIRVPLSKNDDGSLNFACTIPQGARFRIMQGSPSEQIRSAREAAEFAQHAKGLQPIAGVLVFDCVCRSLILGDQFEDGVKAMQAVLGDVPLLGFETYGEICMDPVQFSGFHNTTSVVVLIPA